VGCWILGGLLFYALFTRQLLSHLVIRTHQEFTFFSAWTTLGEWVWNDPGKIVDVAYDTFLGSMIVAFVSAVVGSTPMLILATGRKRRLVGFLLLLSIPLAWIMAVFVQIGIEFADIDKPVNIFDTDLDNRDSYIANAELERVLGFTLPFFGYPVLVAGVLFYILHWFVYHRKSRQGKDRPEGAGP
jgi:hypothetical protein